MATGDDKRAEGFSLAQGSTDSRAVETYYDDWAGTYDETLTEWNYSAPDDAAGLIAPHLEPGARILDVGCGTGLLAEALRAQGDYSVDGIDISARSLDFASKRGGYASLTRHDLQALPLPAETDAYDAAASVGVLTYIDDAGALLADICRCVLPGGVVAFTQRTDRWHDLDFRATVERIAGDGFWTVLEFGEPRPYLPGNEEFADAVEVIHTLCRVN